MIIRAIARRKRPIFLLVLAAAAVAGAVFAARPLGDWLLVRHYRQRISVVEGAEARVLMRQAADLGEPGIKVLVDGLGSANESVAHAAGEVIRDRMEDWKSLRTRYSSPLLARLALELSAAVEQFDGSARAEAARIAEEILKRRLDRYAVDRCQVISACRQVIRLAEATAQPGPSPGNANVDLAAEDQALPDAAARENSAITSVPIAQLAALPGGGLPQTSQPFIEGGRLDEQMHKLTHRFDPRDLGQPLADGQSPTEKTPGDEPRWFNAPRVAQPLDTDRGAARLSGPSGGAMSLPDEDTNNRTRDDGSGQRVSSDTPKSDQAGKQQPCDMQTVDLLRQLNDDATAAAARNELRLRGFKDHHFRVAAKLFDPDPAVRTRLARELLSVPGLNPHPWLLLLARDANSDVRLTAISLLATAADPAILAEVEKLAGRDPDRRIQQQAQRISGRRINR